MMRVAIVQARVGSTRLPGKVLMDLNGRPMLAQVIARLQQCRHIDRIVVATTEHPADNAVEAATRDAGADAFRGPEHDVLARYLGAARASACDIVVRVTADCPLIDPATVDLVVDTLCNEVASADYASNVIRRTYPRGLDVEAFFHDTLERVARRATSADAREHVTYYLLREHPDLFSLRPVADAENNSDLRWTVDERDDLELVRRLYDDLELATRPVPYRDVLAYVRSHPAIGRMNEHVRQKL